MITSLILVDEILDNQLDNEMSLKLVNIFYGIMENGILLDSKVAKYIHSLKQKLGNVSLKYQKEIYTLIEELMKNVRRYFFYCPEEICPHKKCNEQASPLCLAKQCSANTLITCSPAQISNLEVVTLDSYRTSATELQRKKYLSGEPIFSLLTDSDKTTFLKHILIYTKQVSIYDTFLGTATFNVEDFSDTVQYISENWMKCSIFRKSLELNIITLIKKTWSISQIRKHFIDNFLPKIPAPMKINVFLKMGNDDCFHGRFLETDSRVFRCDPGFDFYNKRTASFRTTTFNLDEGLRTITSKIKKMHGPFPVDKFTLLKP